MLTRLLRKNTSPARIAAFVISNFIGLAIILGAMQFYLDARPIIAGDDSFISNDYIVINKRVTGRSTLGLDSGGFTSADTDSIAAQPWARAIGPFTANDFHVRAAFSGASHALSTDMFFEAIPDRFIDLPNSGWNWHEGSGEVPIIISKDYLALYNFGFASGAGMPRLSEGTVGGIPLSLTLTSDDGTRSMQLNGRIAGFSGRLNTILVPEEFMRQTNLLLGTGTPRNPERLIIEVSSPGDPAIASYLEAHDYEAAGDSRQASSTFFLRLVTGIILAVGTLITLLSFAILLLSLSLIMEKNRSTIHNLLMLGYPARKVAAPYRRLATLAAILSLILAGGVTLLLATSWRPPLEALGATPAGPWLPLAVGAILTLLIIAGNSLAIGRRVRAAWR